MSKKVVRIIEWSVVFTVLTALLLLLRFRPLIIVSGESMLPNYSDEDVLYGTTSFSVDRGDVVVVAKDDIDLIKRIIGLPGDTVSVRVDGIYVNGDKADVQNALECEEYDVSEWVLGPDSYFVVGDNRPVSFDSRAFGPVNRETIKIKVLGRLFHGFR